MSKKYDIIKGIGACYNYILKHTDLEPSDDLYQDVAADYIERYNRGIHHGQILSNLASNYKKHSQYMNDEFTLDCYIPITEYDAERVVMDRFMKLALEEALETLTARRREVLYARFYDDKTLKEIAKEYNLSPDRIRQIENKAIRDMRHPRRNKVVRSLYEG